MTSKLATIKELRDMGASIKMIDDVAARTGGYDNPATAPTVELILKLKNLRITKAVEQEQGMDIGSISQGESAKNADYDAAKYALENDEDMDEDDRKKMLEHLAAVQNARDSHIVAENFRQMEELGSFNRPGQENRRKGPSRAAKQGLIDKFNRMISQLSGQKNRQQNQVNNNMQRLNAMQTAEQQKHQADIVHQQQEQQQQQQTGRVGMITRMNLLKTQFLNILKVKNDYSIYGNAQWAEKQKAVQSVDIVVKDAAKKNPSVLQKPNKDTKQTTTELISSKSIDQIIKTDKAKNNAPAQQTEKGHFAEKVGDKAVPKANEEAVAKMAAQEAIAKLQNSGMRTSTADASAANKAAEVERQAQQNAQNAQKQR